MSEITLDTLDHNGLIKLTADGNREVTASIGVFMGNATLTIFTKGSKPTYKFPINQTSIALIDIILKKLVAAPGPKRQPLVQRKWEPEEKKWKPLGGLCIVVEEDLKLFLECSGSGLPERFRFQVRLAPSIDYSNTDLSDRDVFEATAKLLNDTLHDRLPVDQVLTSVKRPKGGYGGGGGGYGGGNKGGYNNGGGGYGGGNSGGGGAPEEHELFT